MHSARPHGGQHEALPLPAAEVVVHVVLPVLRRPLARDGRLVGDHLLQLGVVAGDGAQCLVVESIYEFALHVKGRCLTQEAG